MEKTRVWQRYLNVKDYGCDPLRGSIILCEHIKEVNLVSLILEYTLTPLVWYLSKEFDKRSQQKLDTNKELIKDMIKAGKEDLKRISYYGSCIKNINHDKYTVIVYLNSRDEKCYFPEYCCEACDKERKPYKPTRKILGGTVFGHIQKLCEAINRDQFTDLPVN